MGRLTVSCLSVGMAGVLPVEARGSSIGVESQISQGVYMCVCTCVCVYVCATIWCPTEPPNEPPNDLLVHHLHSRMDTYMCM